MKYAALLLLLTTGCAAKKHATHFVIPPECRGKRELVRGCDPIPGDPNHCIYVIKQEFSCIKVAK